MALWNSGQKPSLTRLSLPSRQLPHILSVYSSCVLSTWACAEAAATQNLDADVKEFWYFPPTPFDPKLVGRVREAAQAQGYQHQDIISGAGHDAVYMARVAPAAMIFVPCVGGISHNEIEDAKQTDLAAGCDVLLRAMIERANA